MVAELLTAEQYRIIRDENAIADMINRLPKLHAQIEECRQEMAAATDARKAAEQEARRTHGSSWRTAQSYRHADEAVTGVWRKVSPLLTDRKAIYDYLEVCTARLQAVYAEQEGAGTA